MLLHACSLPAKLSTEGSPQVQSVWRELHFQRGLLFSPWAPESEDKGVEAVLGWLAVGLEEPAS